MRRKRYNRRRRPNRRRRAMTRRGSRKAFSRTAKKVHRRNLARVLHRGGFML